MWHLFPYAKSSEIILVRFEFRLYKKIVCWAFYLSLSVSIFVSISLSVLDHSLKHTLETHYI